MTAPIAITSLIEKTYLIKRHRENLLNASGENYNVFNTLRLEYDEERLHSRFIADLLNPKGSHRQADFFLKSFLLRLNIPDIQQALLPQTKVYVEDHVGPISKDYLTGGSIDIVIKVPHDIVIIIENKVNAGDQKHQLIRYKNAYPKAHVLYLTKFGDNPSELSTHNQQDGVMMVDFPNDTKCRPISYKIDILEWLNGCYKECIRFPLLRETLHQYISTVKKITNQLTDSYMTNDIAESILSSNANLEGYYILRNSYDINKAIERRLLDRFIGQMIQLAKDLELTFTDADIDRELGHKAQETEINFYVPNSPFSIDFGFDTWRMEFSLGVGGVDGSIDVSLKPQISKHFTDLFGKDADYPNWYYLLYFRNSKLGDEHLAVWDEGKMSVWGAINDGTLAARMKWYFERILNELLSLRMLKN
jgi:hypothetical protein